MYHSFDSAFAVLYSNVSIPDLNSRTHIPLVLSAVLHRFFIYLPYLPAICSHYYGHPRSFTSSSLENFRFYLRFYLMDFSFLTLNVTCSCQSIIYCVYFM
ncbi:hypothetical protein F5878DRAFT_368111 [Lentinula raphanica]|uniref:Uncharacterized protein n=1 Tax=Lentinula raphanica TaxID=153919 RepID=A0AA38P184_9AGAR|nr:hypothetical protein F5878DRAFT_368111 [Lentinula raphanica]